MKVKRDRLCIEIFIVFWYLNGQCLHFIQNKLHELTVLTCNFFIENLTGRIEGWKCKNLETDTISQKGKNQKWRRRILVPVHTEHKSSFKQSHNSFSSALYPCKTWDFCPNKQMIGPVNEVRSRNMPKGLHPVPSHCCHVVFSTHEKHEGLPIRIFGFYLFKFSSSLSMAAPRPLFASPLCTESLATIFPSFAFSTSFNWIQPVGKRNFYVICSAL